MKIKDFSSSERPRERLLSFGPAALSTGELLAILLRGGTSKMNVLDISRNLLNGCEGSLVKLSRMEEKELCTFHGIKSDKAASIIAAFELGRRFMSETTDKKNKDIYGANDAYYLLLPSLKGLNHEEAWMILLDKSHRVITFQSLGIGCSDSVAIGIKEIIRKAMDYGACALILAHNHPSGEASPSKQDIELTKRLHDSCEICGLRLLDHIIVCDSQFYSFADERITLLDGSEKL